MGKRIFDFFCALVGLVAVSPLLIVIAVAVKLTSSGPVFFHQTRVGHHFRPFRIVKFRTMREGMDGPLITASGDRRVTAVGRILRRTKFDELPQLWNVLIGDMSLVGPRPEIPEYVERFRQDYAEILTVRPGITDPASIAFRREDMLLAQADNPETKYLSVILPKKLAMAREYVKARTFLGDLILIFRTIAHV
jgi:lipopolysaccharide/colanic/teichoic acid biosynthesis glycosyltransferase